MTLKRLLKIALRRYSESPEEFIEFTNDYMFCSVMENPEYCKEFLERVLGITIVELKYTVKQKSIRNRYNSRGIRLDVYAVDAAGNSYDIEMQTTRDIYLPERIRYYHSEMDGYKIRKGEKYNKLGKNVVIFVCTYDPFADGKSVYTFKKYCAENKDIALEDGMLSVILNAEGNREGIDENLINLLDYIKTGTATDEYTGKLLERVQELNSDYDWRDRHMTFRMKLEERYEAGTKNGINIANTNAVVNMLSLGVDEDEIRKIYPDEFEEGKKRYSEDRKGSFFIQ